MGFGALLQLMANRAQCQIVLQRAKRVLHAHQRHIILPHLSRVGSGYVGTQQVHTLQLPHQFFGLLLNVPVHHLARFRGPLPLP
jgi:hypothetical protein